MLQPCSASWPVRGATAGLSQIVGRGLFGPLCFSDGFLGVTHPIMRAEPTDLKEVCVTGHWQIPQVGLKLPDFFIQK